MIGQTGREEADPRQSSVLSSPAHRFRAARYNREQMRLLVLFVSLAGISLWARDQLTITIIDENRLPIEHVLVTVRDEMTGQIQEGQTDSRGRLVFTFPSSGRFQVRAEKKGYYPSILRTAQLLAQQTNLSDIEIVLAREQELTEQVEVVSSPARLDPRETAASQKIAGTEIVNVPFPATRDIRNALPLIAGVIQDHAGGIHVDGADSSQTQIRLDGFKIGNPGTGAFDTRIVTDAIRSIQLQSSRLSSEYGSAPGGVFDLTSGSGDDNFRFSTTDFFPSFQSKRGFHLDNWTPRMTVSGPLAKGRAWFYQALDGEYGVDIFEELPVGQDRNHTWRIGGLSKVQVNLGRSHVLSGIWLLNRSRADHAGLSPFHPLETSVDRRAGAYLAGIQSMSYFTNGLLLETALGITHNSSDEIPMGNSPYEIHLERTKGNYYRSPADRARRVQFMAAVTFSDQEWHGRHEIKLGTEADAVTYRVASERGPIRLFDSDGRMSREIFFTSASPYSLRNHQIGAFLQDRWSLSDRLLLELGIRADREDLLRDISVSPRIAASYRVRRRSKLTAGVGLFHDTARLDLLIRPFSGRRFDLPTGAPGPVESAFIATAAGLDVPLYVNWSASWEEQLRDALLLSFQLMGKAGWRGWVYEPLSTVAEEGRREFHLRSSRRDSYKALKIGLSGTPRTGHTLSAFYTLSSASSSHLLHPDLDNVITGPLGEGPVAWDVPHRLQVWGWSNLTKRLQVAFSLEWRTGLPFSVLDEDQVVVGTPNSMRFPGYFSLNLHLERRFRFASYEWAFRGGFNNITNHPNPSAVNNNSDSPGYLEFTGFQDRAFVGRIRFLGKK